MTEWTYDENSNLLSVEDGENQTTSYVYDDRNLQTSTTWPDHDPMSSPGDPDYGITSSVFDAAGRNILAIDQKGDTVSRVYDLAGRMLQRDYRQLANSPTGMISDSDVFTYNDAGRLLTAVSGRYSNTVTLSHTTMLAGLLANHSLRMVKPT